MDIMSILWLDITLRSVKLFRLTYLIFPRSTKFILGLEFSVRIERIDLQDSTTLAFSDC